MESEATFWHKQIERHHIGKRIRNLARRIEYKPYISLAIKLKVSRKTIWALANGLATTSSGLIKRIEELERLEIK